MHTFFLPILSDETSGKQERSFAFVDCKFSKRNFRKTLFILVESKRVSVLGSSCNYLFFRFVSIPLFSPSIYWHLKAAPAPSKKGKSHWKISLKKENIKQIPLTKKSFQFSTSLGAAKLPVFRACFEEHTKKN